MDQIDHRIVRALQRDGRMTISDLADKVGLSPTPCARRLERLQRDGVITGYSARVDPAKLGLGVSVFVSVELERQERAAVDAFERAIRTCDEVMECYLMTGSRDILLRVLVADLAAFDAFLENRLMQIPGIRNLRSNFALRTMVQRDSLPAIRR
ncbi:Lrp/AsnC family transcriptional regulator [Ruegeria pomeroyi]|uniref:Transcriptional regulator, AsnC family n=2 Tax=Ruegeria pomeroyi TaxID=89184 RepID=Q5LXH4_RUEPO|nr:Lrp/AsnC family transcriptional regulator [Ruegeria pomeroyi]HCE70937.1 Lrp/AsnC family transcriptional regulator [Ruegeria sp.]AAV93707.1 transcriptional regulator, AsnC family [Ruegeria pomeroyi DSS-3]MCE8544864.1 Lrp/AsnC family transcriptional regulator [Ruegeria pomeroyi]NVK98563.1 Lrp/AsnC family transcriptional regulator [Ruegeria pomeroyi]NVK99882.1 Lrp/AsnC family transcriptional regulator [Ruegeria pomeroyi]